MPWAKVFLPQLPAFIPVYESAVFINDAITAVMLFGLFRLSRARALWWMSTAYLFTSVLALVHMMTFPGLFTSTGLLGAGTQTTAWLYIAWHTGFPLLVALSSARGRAPLRLPAPVLASVVLVLGLAGGLVLVTTRSWMPVVIENGVMTDLMRNVVMPLVLGAGLAAMLLLWFKRPPTVLDRWLWAAMAAWCCEVALSATFNAGRFDLGFYSGRVFGLVSSCLILWVLLRENSALYGQLEQSNGRLREAGRFKSPSLTSMSREISDEGIRELYRTLLSHFAEQWAETVKQLEAAGASGDRGQLARVARGVKRTAGNLGIAGVAEAAEALESALLRSEPDEAVADLVQALEAAGAAVSGLLPKGDGELEV